MSEDRTQAPSKRRRELAREHGQEAHSPELTAAAGWLLAVLLLGIWGDDLMQAMVGLVRRPLLAEAPLWADPAAMVSHVRGMVLETARPLLGILVGFMLGALAIHQMQVRGLWATAIIAPDPARLWRLGHGPGLSAGVERTIWAIVKTIVLVVAGFLTIRAEWAQVQRLGLLDDMNVAGAAGHVMLQPLRVMSLVMLVLGLVDFALRYTRFEAMLRTTAEEQREDQKAMEGDLSLRSRRRRIARAWRGDAPELLAGASLVLTGEAGLTLVLSGGPPPRPLTVRSAAQGNTGITLRRSAQASRLATIHDPALALRIGRLPGINSARAPVLPADLAASLAVQWPAK